LQKRMLVLSLHSQRLDLQLLKILVNECAIIVFFTTVTFVLMNIVVNIYIRSCQSHLLLIMSCV